MALQWSAASTPTFPSSVGADVTAAKNLSGGNSITMSFKVSFDVEGPAPSDTDLLGYLGTLYNALEADGWTTGLQISQTNTVHRQIEEV